jgi:hypothetical protein
VFTVSPLLLRDPLRQPLQLMAVDHLVLHHSDQQLFDRAAAEAIHDVAYRARRNIAAAVKGAIDVGAAIHFVAQKPLLLQAPQNGAHRGILHDVFRVQRLAAGFGGYRTAGPHVVHDQLLERAETAHFLRVCHRCLDEARLC